MSLTIPPVILQPPYDAPRFIEAVQASVRGMFEEHLGIRALTYLMVIDHPDDARALEVPLVLALAAETTSRAEDRYACSCAARQIVGKLRTLGVAFATEGWGIPRADGYRLGQEELATRPRAEKLVALMVEHRSYEGVIKGWRAQIRPGPRLGPWVQLRPLQVAPDDLILSNPLPAL